MRKPRVLTKCVANSYAGPDERIVEFSANDGSSNGGLIRLFNLDGRLFVQLYRLEGVTVIAGNVRTVFNDKGDEVTLSQDTDIQEVNSDAG